MKVRKKLKRVNMSKFSQILQKIKKHMSGKVSIENLSKRLRKVVNSCV